ncbi:MAG: outer membrane beta-barrel protein [Saprospiraceae bacterium]|nr:outer membrane beta-barrel protein [Saprospiraceae bacterium]
MQKYLSILFLLVSISLSAQDFSLGVRIGLNFNQFISPSELSMSGADLESYDFSTGFLIGATGEVEITDLFGLRAELLYTQKGGKRKYDGQGVQIFNPGTSDAVLAVGDRFSLVRVTNSYMQIPLLAYVQPIRQIKIFGGVSAGLLIGSYGTGEMKFTGVSNNNSTPIEFTSNVDHNYLKDEGFNDINPDSFEDPFMFFADGSQITVPRDIGAYYLDFAEKGDPYFNRIDLGLMAGAGFYLNSSLYLSLMADIGLTDSSNQDYDLSFSSSNGDSQIFQDDSDRQFSLQASLGFQF